MKGTLVAAAAYLAVFYSLQFIGLAWYWPLLAGILALVIALILIDRLKRWS